MPSAGSSRWSPSLWLSAGQPPTPPNRSLTFAGRQVVSRIQAEFGLPSQHLVKPGAGEATRVLLRRLPWLVLVRPDRRDMLEHLLLLAKERGVEVMDYPDMPYSCVGLVKPQAEAGA